MVPQRMGVAAPRVGGKEEEQRTDRPQAQTDYPAEDRDGGRDEGHAGDHAGDRDEGQGASRSGGRGVGDC